MTPANPYDPAWVASWFDELGEGEWARWDEGPAAEVGFHLHRRMLERFVERGSRVLEVGAGPGRFTRELATLGCLVVVTDLSPVQLDLHRKKAREEGFEAAVEDRRLLDVCDMQELDDGGFDAVVAYGGPLSYVFERAEAALGECRRVVRDGGVVLIGVMSLWGSCHRFLPGTLAVPPEANRRIVETGDLSPASWRDVTHRCHLFRTRELRELVARSGLTLEAMMASGVLAPVWGDEIQAIRHDPPAWAELLRLEEEACQEEGCLDMGTHLVAAARR